MKKKTVIQDETGMFDQNCELTLWPEDPITKEHLEKYNQCHGDRGRFCSGGGGGGGGGGTSSKDPSSLPPDAMAVNIGGPDKEEPLPAGITREEKMAMQDYVGADYAFINTWMRNPDNGGNPADREFYLRKAARVQKVIDKQPPLKGEEIVYRGLRADKKMKEQLVPGAIIQDKGFMSTSIDREVAKNFGDTVMTIRVPKGTKALKVWDVVNTVTTRNERELLLGRDTKLKITRVREEKGGFLGFGKKTYIEARVVDE